MSLHLAKLLKNPLALASAALVIHIGAAAAADSRSDVQQQMKELLTGTTPAHVSAPTAPRVGQVTSPSVDAQDFAKQLLLGTTGSRTGVAVATEHSEARHVTYADMQSAVRLILLGQKQASDAS
jgi:hypothetical protein